MITTLDYAARIPWFKRKGIRRLCVLFTLLLVLATTSFVLRHKITWSYHRMLMLSYQQKCLDYALSPGTLVYTEDATEIAALRSSLDYTCPTSTAPLKFGWASRRVKCYDEFLAHAAGTSSTFGTIQPTPLLHGLTTPDGQRHLVVVQLLPYFDTTSVHFVSYILQPRTFSGTDQSFYEHVFRLPAREVPPTAGHPLRIFAADIDPRDPSRFTIPYEYLGRRGHFTGQLTNSPYPQLTLTHADGPLLPTE